jgi:hypothetical protein
MSNPILTEDEAQKAAAEGQQINPSTPADQAQQIANQQPGAVLPPEQAAQVVAQQGQPQNPPAEQQQQQQEAVQAVSMGAPPPPPQAQPVQKSQSEEIDKTIRGLLIQIIALQHNKESQA